MKDFKATLYDLKGYLVPGLLVLVGLVEASSFARFHINLEILTFSFPAKATIAIVVAYVLGHALHAVSNYTIDRLPYTCYHSKEYFDQEFVKDFSSNTIDALIATIGIRFGVSFTGKDESEKKEFVKQQYWSIFQWTMKSGIADVEKLPWTYRFLPRRYNGYFF